MTSNIGSGIIQEQFENYNEGNKEEVLAETKNKVMELLKRSIRPEFLNRVDDVIMFTPLTREHIREIVEVQFREIQATLGAQDIHFSATEEALDWLSQLGYEPQYGARPLKRVLQRKVLNELSKEILSGQVRKDSTILLALDDKNNLVFQNQ